MEMLYREIEFLKKYFLISPYRLRGEINDFIVKSLYSFIIFDKMEKSADDYKNQEQMAYQRYNSDPIFHSKCDMIVYNIFSILDGYFKKELDELSNYNYK
jgi:hypothetical protein